MGILAGIFAGGLVLVLLVWGIASPQSQWRVLSSWAYKNPEAQEPSAAAYGVTRFTNVVVLIVLIVVGVILWGIANKGREKEDLARQWGTEKAVISPAVGIDKKWSSTGEAPILRDVPLTRYQRLEGNREPRYLWKLDLARASEPGTTHASVETALDGAALVVAARPGTCAIAEVRTQETSSSVTVDVVGQVTSTVNIIGIDPKYVKYDCDGVESSGSWGSTDLVPVKLKAPLGDRSVVDKNGKALERVD